MTPWTGGVEELPDCGPGKSPPAAIKLGLDRDDQFCSGFIWRPVSRAGGVEHPALSEGVICEAVFLSLIFMYLVRNFSFLRVRALVRRGSAQR